MTNCATCYGLIMEPMKSYGYAGKVCNCTPPVYTQHPMTSKKHDAERQSFEDWGTNKKGWNMRRNEDGSYFYHEQGWIAWQARAAVVKPVLTGQQRAELQSLIVGASDKFECPYCDYVATMGTHAHPCVGDASTGNTERKLDVIYEKCGGDIRPMLPLMSPIFSESPLSEQELQKLILDVLLPISKHSVLQDNVIAHAIAMAIVPHLSDTSAENARVDGLVEAAKTLLNSDMAMREEDEGNESEVLNQLRKAIAAFEGV